MNLQEFKRLGKSKIGFLPKYEELEFLRPTSFEILGRVIPPLIERKPMSFEEEWFKEDRVHELFTEEELDKMAGVMLDGMITDWENNDPAWKIKEPFFSYNMSRFGKQDSQAWPMIARLSYDAATSIVDGFHQTAN
jgi:hypothetical protein